MPSLIIVAAFIVVLFVIFLVWTNHETRLQPGYRLGKQSSSHEYDLAQKEPNLDATRANLATGYSDLDALSLGRLARMKVANLLTTNIDRPFLITFPMSVYINQPFEVKVCIGSEQGKLPDLIDNEKRASPPGDRLQFPAHEDKPPIQIELQFAKEDFSANTTKQQKPLEKDKPTIFSFLVKPLKAEACILTVVISYAPNKVDDTEIEETPEKVEKTTTDTTDATGNAPAKTEHKEVVTRTSSVSAPIMVKTEEMKIEVKSLFGLNAAELTIWKSIIGIVAALILLAIALITKKTDGWNAVVLVIGCAASAFGAPIYNGITNLFNLK